MSAQVTFRPDEFDSGTAGPGNSDPQISDPGLSYPSTELFPGRLIISGKNM